MSHRFEITLIVNTNDTTSYHMLITTYRIQWLNKLLSKEEKRIYNFTNHIKMTSKLFSVKIVVLVIS